MMNLILQRYEKMHDVCQKSMFIYVLLIISEPSVSLQGVPQTVASFRIQLLYMLEKLTGSGAVGSMFVGAMLELFLIVAAFGILADVVLTAEAEGADDGERHLAHA